MLDTISESKVLENLRNRYKKDLIYTNIANVVISLNPFKRIPALYSNARMASYHNKKYFECSPHIYALADSAYRSMVSHRENQCVIISGESGSGKTEASKLIMQYIAGVTGKSAEVQRVKERMLSSNPLLEAFGNAKTVNNNNSSRFGKYMEILFDLGGEPVGGRVTNYLLEKSRVVQPGLGERNFHIFYQVTKGATPEEREALSIYDPEYYYYLNQSQCYAVDGIDDVSDFAEMREAMEVMAMTEEEQFEVLRVVSLVLWLGNIDFSEDDAEHSSVVDMQYVEYAAHLLGVDSAAVAKALTTREITTGHGARAETFVKPCTSEQAYFSRDTLAKALYSQLFDYLVIKVNESIKKPNHKGIMIGVLDIYGFEIFEYNSFEQLCINFVNERLQQIFIELTLKAEQEEYAQEGIPWTDIDYYNNKPLCDLIEGKPGLLSICDDCCHTAKTDQMFVQDLKNFFSSNQALYCSNSDFTIVHYAGEVCYQAEGFLTKNKDTLFDDLKVLIQSSPMAFVAQHGWAKMQVSKGQKKRPLTVGTTFKRQVVKLMDALKACVPHYIRCIKTNNDKVPNKFDNDNIRRQVQYLGLLESIRVRRAGYAFRSTYTRFVSRYKLINRAVLRGEVYGEAYQLCETILQGLHWTNGNEYALGATKVFIRQAESMFLLEDLLERKFNEAVIIIQKAWRRYKRKRYYLEMRAKAYDVVAAGRKERRRLSMSRDYRGDYLNFAYNDLAAGLLSMASGAKEPCLFSDRTRVALLKGKRSIFGKIASALSGGSQLTENRFLMLSDEALYCFTFVEAPKQGTAGAQGQMTTKAKLYYRVELNQIASITMSKLADNYLVLHFAAGAPVVDQLLACRRKTELVGLIQYNYKKKHNGQALPITFADADQVSVGKKRDKVVTIAWLRDETVPPNEDQIVPVKDGNVEIHVASGVPFEQVPEPYRPPEHDLSVPARPALQALYGYAGNGVDELTFNPGDVIFIVIDEADGWYKGELNGKQGYVPATYVERMVRKPKPKPKPQPKQRIEALRQAKPDPKPTVRKSNWVELTTEQGDVYYWNEVTGESAWSLDGLEEEAKPVSKAQPAAKPKPKPVVKAQPKPNPVAKAQPKPAKKWTPPKKQPAAAVASSGSAAGKRPSAFAQAASMFGSRGGFKPRGGGRGGGAGRGAPARPAHRRNQKSFGSRVGAAMPGPTRPASRSRSRGGGVAGRGGGVAGRWQPKPKPQASASSTRPKPQRQGSVNALAARFAAGGGVPGGGNRPAAQAKPTPKPNPKPVTRGGGGVSALAKRLSAINFGGAAGGGGGGGGGGAAAAQPAASAPAPATAEADGWVKCLDEESGYHYLYNATTGESKWLTE